jgi:alpha-D-ribose 1-methylphosphonate 5-triphosphate synthase subunit PhnH
VTASTLDLGLVHEGFAEPVASSQACFRTVLDALANPGTPYEVPFVPGARLNGLAPAAAAMALTLFDQDTVIWLSPDLQRSEVAAFLRFHCGAPLTINATDADFALVARPQELPALDSFATGTESHPDRATTVVIETSAWSTAHGWHLRGPGIRNEGRLAIDGLGSSFTDMWRANRKRYPCGVDVIFVCGASIVGLPRSTRIH